MTLLSDCGMAPMVIHPVREVNRAFSAGGLFLSYKSWGAAPGSPENTHWRYDWRLQIFLAESAPGFFGTPVLNILKELLEKL